jgi:hypothetical protein
MASEDSFLDRYVPVVYTALWPLQLLELTRAQTIKILLLAMFKNSSMIATASFLRG